MMKEGGRWGSVKGMGKENAQIDEHTPSQTDRQTDRQTQTDTDTRRHKQTK